jgi:hypothetical protein
MAAQLLADALLERATVNDLILTALAGALGSYMRRREFDTEGLVLKALVPVSVRGKRSGQAVGARALVELSGFASPTIVSLARLQAR